MMERRSRAPWFWRIFWAAWLLLCPALSQSQFNSNQFSTPQPYQQIDAQRDSVWQYDLLQLLLEERQMRVERSRLNILENPKKSVIVVGNDGNYSIRLRPQEMVDYVERGGALLLMHELNSPGRAEVLAVSGLGTFYKGPVTAISANDMYEGYLDCIRVTDINDREGLFAGIKTLVTNVAGWFRPSDANPWDWETVATFPAATIPTDVKPKRLICIGRPRNADGGMAIIISDSSLLTNNMLWHGDNSRLALRLSEIFQQQGRDRFHMVRNNESLDSVSKRLAEKLRSEQAKQQPANLQAPKPTLSQLLTASNVVAKEIVDSGVLNEALQRRPRNVSPDRYFRFLLMMLIAGSIVWILWKLLTSPNFRELWLARRRQRFAYEIHSGNEAGDYRTAASYLAQEFCVQWTGSYHSRHWQQALATLLARQPSVTPADRNELTRIVDIASRGCHERMPATEFQKFGKTIDTLRQFLVTATPA